MTAVPIARKEPIAGRDKLRRVVELGLLSATTLLMVDRAVAHTGPAHWAHRRVHRFLHLLGLGRCGGSSR